MNTASQIREDPVRIAGNVAALLLSKAFTSALLLVWQIVLARKLGAGEYGVYGTIGALMAIAATVADFGTGVIVVRDVARRPDQASRYFNASLALSLLLAVVGYFAVQASARWFGYDASLRAMLLFVGLNLAIDVVGTSVHNVLVATERIPATAALSAAHIVVLVAFGSIGLEAGGSLWTVYGVMFAAAILRSAGYALIARRDGFLAVRKVDPELARHILGAGAPLGVAAFVSLGFLHSDKLVSTAILGASATGQLTAAFVILFGLVELFGTTVLVAALPSMARQDSLADEGASMPVLERLLPLGVLVGAPLAIVLVVSGKGIATLVFGSGFEGAGAVLRVMGPCVFISMVEGALAQVLTVKNQQSRVLAARAAGLALNLATTIALLPRIGVAGAAYGMLFGQSTTVLAMLRLVNPPRIWWRSVGRKVSRLAVPLVVLAVVLVFSHDRLPVIVAVAAALAAYVGLAVVSGAVTADDRRLLLHVVWLEPAEVVARWRSRA